MIAPQEKSKDNSFAYLILALTLLLVARLLPMLKGPVSTFGYDYGFYFDAAKNAHGINWQDLLTAFWGGFNNPLFYLFNLFHIPPELSLTLSYLIFTLLLGLSLYWLFSPRDKTAGLFALILYSVSTVQMESYLMFLYKNAFALPFMILGFKFLMEKKWRLFILSSVLIIFTHRTTAIIYLLTIGLYFIWELIRSKRYRLLSILLTSCFLLLILGYYFLNLKSIISNLISNNNYLVRTGLFLPFDNPFKLVWPYLLLAVPGIVIWVKNKQNPLLIFFTGVCLLWLIFHLPFYRRVWIYFDLSLIIFAAYFLSSLLSWPFGPELMVEGQGEGRVRSNFSKYFSASIIILFLFTGYRFTTFTLAKQPLIRTLEVQEIKTFNRERGMVLAVSANDAPWLLAFADKYRLGAPGLLEDPHTYEEWMAFWRGENQRQFISEYPRPLYFYQRAYRLQSGDVAQCLKPLSENFSELDYGCLEKTPN